VPADEVVKPRLIALAEEALGMEVGASVTGIGVLDDVATETFLLASAPGPPRLNRFLDGHTRFRPCPGGKGPG